MRIAFLHHHLRPGGVSRVIQDQIRSIEPDNEALVICGEDPGSAPSFPCLVIPALAYDRDRTDKTTPQRAAHAVLDAVHSVWKNGADLIHVHNPTLGKNSDFIAILKELQSMGENLLLQIHDFAEDGRPQNYRNQEYPENCHYAVLNGRDYEILIRCGLCEEGLHLLPNAVHPLPVEGGRKDEHEDTVLYPVRAIRRKNIGEAVLVSLFLPPEKRIGITLEPTGAIDRESYAGWRNFVASMNLPVSFGLGLESDLDVLLKRTASMVTTSIKEGFGFSFLEPWTAHRMLHGRLLATCGDFIRNKIDIAHLYTRLSVSTSLFDIAEFRKMWELCYTAKMQKYGLAYDKELIERSIDTLCENGSVDFGYLNEKLQEQVIISVYENRNYRKNLLDMNPSLLNIDGLSSEQMRIEANRNSVLRIYSLKNNRKRLMQIYNLVKRIAVHHRIDRMKLLAAFNTPMQSQLLLCEESFER